MQRISILLLLITLLIAGCARSDVQTAMPVPDTAQEQETEEPTTETEPTPEETEEPAVEAPATNLVDGCVENYAEGINYFPEQVEQTYVTNFTVEYHDNYKLVTVPEAWPGADQPFEYVLVQCGTPAPEGFDEALVIEVPVQAALVMSTSYVTHLDDLEMLDRLVGLDSFSYVMNPTVRQMIDAGELVEISPTGMEVNVEVALDTEPDMIMAFSSGMPEYDLHPALIEAGLPVVLNGDWMEQTPLARAEWIKFMALFFNAEAKAATVFNDIDTQYQDISALAAGSEDNPTVFTDLPYQGTWYIPGGQSYTATLIGDAGGDYLWADDESTGTLFLDFETVFDKAQDADVWLNVFGGYTTLADILAADERFGEFAAFQNGNVYAMDARSNDFGTEIFETGVAHPHIWLMDLVKIFHPDLLPDHDLYYYRLMPAE